LRGRDCAEMGFADCGGVRVDRGSGVLFDAARLWGLYFLPIGCTSGGASDPGGMSVSNDYGTWRGQCVGGDRGVIEALWDV
jgi:hypothetical protein